MTAGMRERYHRRRARASDLASARGVVAMSSEGPGPANPAWGHVRQLAAACLDRAVVARAAVAPECRGPSSATRLEPNSLPQAARRWLALARAAPAEAALEDAHEKLFVEIESAPL